MEMHQVSPAHKVSPLRPTPVVSELADNMGLRLRTEYDRGFIYGENVGLATGMRRVKQAEDRALWTGTVIGGAIGAVLTATIILWGLPS